MRVFLNGILSWFIILLDFKRSSFRVKPIGYHNINITIVYGTYLYGSQAAIVMRMIIRYSYFVYSPTRPGGYLRQQSKKVRAHIL